MRDAAVINRRDKSGNVANDSATEPDNERLPVKPRSNHPVANSADLLKRFRFLVRRNCDQCRPKTCCYQTFLQAPGEKWGNVVIGNHRASFASETLARVRSNLLQQTRADKYAITLLIKRNGRAGTPFFYCVGSQWVAVS